MKNHLIKRQVVLKGMSALVGLTLLAVPSLHGLANTASSSPGTESGSDTARETTEASTEADNLQYPELVAVANLEAATERGAVWSDELIIGCKIKQANPTVQTIIVEMGAVDYEPGGYERYIHGLSGVKGGTFGTAHLTFSDGSTATLTPEQTVRQAERTRIQTNQDGSVQVILSKDYVDTYVEVYDVDENQIENYFLPGDFLYSVEFQEEVEGGGDIEYTGGKGPGRVNEEEAGPLPEGWSFDEATSTLTIAAGILKSGEAIGTYQGGTIGTNPTVQLERDYVLTPPEKTAVSDVYALTAEEKEAVRIAVAASNPRATAVTVADNGTATLSYTIDKDFVEKYYSVDSFTGEQSFEKTLAPEYTIQFPAPAAPIVEAKVDGAVTVQPADTTYADKLEVTYIPEGATDSVTITVTKDTNGNWTVPSDSGLVVDPVTGVITIPAEQVADDTTVSVHAYHGNSVASPKTEVIAREPAAPTVEPLDTTATVVTGKTEENAVIEVTLPDGSKIVGQADENGHYSVPVSGLKGGDTLFVVAIDVAGNRSEATVVTVREAPSPTPPSDTDSDTNSDNSLPSTLNSSAPASSTQKITPSHQLPSTGEVVQSGLVLLGMFSFFTGVVILVRKKKV